MAETENLGRKKKMRAAHRASATRMIAQAQELLDAEGGADPPKLKHKRQALAAKAELLSKLDEEIVEATHEDELEEEVETADTVRERIELTMIKLDSALDLAADKLRGLDLERPGTRRSDPATEPTHHPERSEGLASDSSTELPPHVPPARPSSEEDPAEQRDSLSVRTDPSSPTVHQWNYRPVHLESNSLSCQLRSLVEISQSG